MSDDITIDVIPEDDYILDPGGIKRNMSRGHGGGGDEDDGED